mgnify:CR=1 FL=1
MQIFSNGSLYIGMDKEKFCDIDIHLGRFVIQYECANPMSIDGQIERSIQEDTDG